MSSYFFHSVALDSIIHRVINKSEFMNVFNGGEDNYELSKL